MKVKESEPDLITQLVAAAEMHPDQPYQDDIHWFAAQLQQKEVQDSRTAAATSPSVLSTITHSISANQREKNGALHDLTGASRSNNAEDISRASSSLAEYYIKTLMGTKVISKGIQAFDKLTNLQ